MNLLCFYPHRKTGLSVLRSDGAEFGLDIIGFYHAEERERCLLALPHRVCFQLREHWGLMWPAIR